MLQVLLARAVICAVPLTQLQKQALQLSPAPGPAFQRTLQATRVHNAVKLWAVFRVPFWESAAPLRRATAAAAAAALSGDEIPSALALDGVPSYTGSDDMTESEPQTDAGTPDMERAPGAPRLKPARTLAAASSLSGSTRTLNAQCSIGGSSPSDDEDSVPSRTGSPAQSCSSNGTEEGAAPEFWNMLCPECPVPEFWVPQHAPDGLEDATGAAVVGAADRTTGGRLAAAPLPVESVHVLQGFACAAKADALSALGPAAAVQVFLDQLDQIFSASDAKSPAAAAAAGPASTAFVRGGVMDWGKEPYIEGGYSSPSVGLEAGARAALQGLPGGTVFFAGEHTHERLNACLQGAMETGVRAATQAMQSLGGGRGPEES